MARRCWTRSQRRHSGAGGEVSILITISGIDGSGKSTQITGLQAFLQMAGVRHETIWYRPGYSGLLDRVRALVRSATPGALPASHDSPARERAFSRPGVSEAWIAIALADLLGQYAARIRLLLRKGLTVICDRYLEDAHLDFSFRFPQYRFDPVFEVLARVCPRPDLAFCLYVSREEMERRTRSKAEPFPDPDDVRIRRYQAYQRLRSRFTAVDANRSIDEVQDTLRSHVAGLLGSQGNR